jgi:hypothetical protein
VKDEGKYGILLNIYDVNDSWKRTECIYESIKVFEKDYEYYTVAKRGGKWGLIDWFEGFMAVDFFYDAPEDVPLIQMELWEFEQAEFVKKKLEADQVVYDPNNGDGIIKARNKETKKWGMFQAWDTEIHEMIPMKYDSLNFFGWNGEFTSVYNNGKVGFYLADGYSETAVESIDCIYEDYRIFTNIDKEYSDTRYLAVKKDGFWGWLDWLNDEEKSEFKYITPENLPFPTYSQSPWRDE